MHRCNFYSHLKLEKKKKFLLNCLLSWFYQYKAKSKKIKAPFPSITYPKTKQGMKYDEMAQESLQDA